MRDMAGVDILTRLYDLADLPLFDQLVFSIMGQVQAGPVRLNVMLQRFSFDQVQAVRQAISGLRRLDAQVSVTLHNWDNPAPRDLRVPLLNWGLDVAQSRYLTCLDVHDQLYPDACAALLRRLKSTDAAVALGGAALQWVWLWGDVTLPILKQPDAPASPPVFMVDRDRLAFKDCVFRSSETDSEIKEFIERICARYPADAVCRSDMLALRMCAV